MPRPLWPSRIGPGRPYPELEGMHFTAPGVTPGSIICSRPRCSMKIAAGDARSLERDVFAQPTAVSLVITDVSFIDIGTPESLALAGKGDRKRLGRHSTIISGTPFRISLFSGTDYPAWFSRSAGGSTIMCYISVRHLPPFENNPRSFYSKVELVKNVEEVNQAVRSILTDSQIEEVLDPPVDADRLPAVERFAVPLRSACSTLSTRSTADDLKRDLGLASASSRVLREVSVPRTRSGRPMAASTGSTFIP